MAWKLPTDAFIESAHIIQDEKNQRDNTKDFNFYLVFVVSQPYVTDHDEKLFWVVLLLIIRCFAQWMDDNLQILLHSFCQRSTYDIDA